MSNHTCMKVLNQIIVKASSTRVLTTNGWYYFGCNKCTAKVVGDIGEYGCTRCENKVPNPIPRYLLRFEVTNHTRTALFTALDSKVQRIVHATASDMVMLGEDEGKREVVAAFEELLNVDKDYQITLSVFINNNKTNPSFTVTRMPITFMPSSAATPTIPDHISLKVEFDPDDKEESPCKRTKLEPSMLSSIVLSNDETKMQRIV
ncbi:hypothetical protein MKX01_040692 [Papaver californicum]|nr:hypothetical protein MKX01_040692 [Papaver californicum]